MQKSETIEAAKFIQIMKAKSGLSQSEIARRTSGVLPQRTISRIEADPFSASVENLSLYLKIIGTNVSEMEYFIKMTKVSEMENFKSSKSELIQSEVKRCCDKIESAIEKLMAEECGREELKSRGALDCLTETIDLAKSICPKPIIGFYGLFDSAKSTVINTLLGQQWMPEGYQPETSIVNIIAHSSDKPEWMLGDVAVFREGFMPSMLNNYEYAQEFLIEQGYKDILQRLGRHQYLEGSTDHAEAAISIVFVNSDALNGVWFMDTPGDLSSVKGGEEDRRKAEDSLHLCDGVVFMSPVAGFLSGASLAYFNAVMKSIPPLKIKGGKALDHVRIIMSHAHPGVTERQIFELKQKIANNFDRYSEGIFDYWTDISEVERATAQEFVDCMQPFYREDEGRYASTVLAIKKLCDYSISVHEERVVNKIHDYEKDATEKLEKIKLAMQADMRSCEVRIEEAESNYLRFRENDLPALSKDADDLVRLVNETKKDANDDFSSWYSSNINLGAIELYIDSNFGDRKQAQSDAAPMIMSRIDQYISKRMKRDTDHYSRSLDNFLQQWEVKVNCHSFQHVDNTFITSGSFDARAALLAGIVGLSSYGAMAVYAASLGNLGGYIIGAKLAGLLVSAGVLTEVTAISSGMALIGGPLTIILGIALLITGLVYKVFGDRWQKTLAKDIFDEMEKEQILEKLLDGLDDYWNQTKVALKKGVSALKNSTKEYYLNAIENAKIEYDPTHLHCAIISIQSTIDIVS